MIYHISDMISARWETISLTDATLSTQEAPWCHLVGSVGCIETTGAERMSAEEILPVYNMGVYIAMGRVFLAHPTLNWIIERRRGSYFP